MNQFIERIKSDRMAQLVLLGLILFIIVFLWFIKNIFIGKKEKIPCYRETIVLWTPFPKYELDNFLTPFKRYCVNFVIEEKSIDEIKNEFVYSLAQGTPPNFVYIDNDFWEKNKKLFATATPISIDNLVTFYNKGVLDFLNMEKLRTNEEVSNFIKEIKKYKKEFYPIGLGTRNVKNRKEIIFTLSTLKEVNSYNFKENLTFAIQKFLSFSDIQNEDFSYPETAGSDLENFANERLGAYIGFYQDKKEILKINPRLNFEIGPFSLNTFPPKVKVYTKIYYLAVPKGSRKAINSIFLDWFLSQKLSDFVNNFDLVPFKEIKDLDEQRKVVLYNLRLGSETFDFLSNKDIIFNRLDDILTLWNKDRNRAEQLLEQTFYIR